MMKEKTGSPRRVPFHLVDEHDVCRDTRLNDNFSKDWHPPDIFGEVTLSTSSKPWTYLGIVQAANDEHCYALFNKQYYPLFLPLKPFFWMYTEVTEHYLKERRLHGKKYNTLGNTPPYWHVDEYGFCHDKRLFHIGECPDWKAPMLFSEVTLPVNSYIPWRYIGLMDCQVNGAPRGAFHGLVCRGYKTLYLPDYTHTRFIWEYSDMAKKYVLFHKMLSPKPLGV